MKLIRQRDTAWRSASHPARGAWIEIIVRRKVRDEVVSHPARGAWIEMATLYAAMCVIGLSHPARGAWIEILALTPTIITA